MQEIDTSKLTNWDKVPDSFKALGQIDGKQYYVPWDWGFTSILYNTEHVPEVDSWDALFDPDYDRPHLDVGRRAGGGDRVGLHQRLGRDRHHRRPAGADRAGLEGPEAAEPALLGLANTRPLPGGRAAATSGSPTPGRAATRTALYEGTPVAYANPRRVATRGSACMASAPTSDSPELALQFLDDKLAELTCSNAVTLFYYGCANSEVMDADRRPGADRGLRHRRPVDPGGDQLHATGHRPSSATPGPRCGRGSRPSSAPRSLHVTPRRGGSRCWAGAASSRFLALPPSVWLALLLRGAARR